MSNQQISTQVNMTDYWEGAGPSAGQPTGRPLTVLEAQAASRSAIGVAALRPNLRRTAYAAAVRAFGASLMTPPPVPTVALKATGNIVYCNPDVAGPGTGTFGDPYKFPGTHTFAAGDTMLIAVGRTAQLFAPLGFGAVTGTVNAPIIIGLYDPTLAPGIRITGLRGGATLDGFGTPVCCVLLSSLNYWCIDGFRVRGNSNAAFGQIQLGGTGSNNQVLNCIVENPLGFGIKDDTNASASGNVIEGNEVFGATIGIFVDLQNGANNTLKIQYNNVHDCQVGIATDDFGNNNAFGGSIENNIVVRCSNAAGCINVRSGGGAFKALRNFCQDGENGIAWTGSQATRSNFTGSLIQGNVVRNCAFGISSRLSRGARVQVNEVYDSGIGSDGQPVDKVSFYGRAYEFFGETEATGCHDLLIEFNYAYRAFCLPNNIGGPGTEGVGFGLDNNCQNCVVRSNIAELCEGSGYQCGPGVGNVIAGNLSYDCLAVAPSRFRADVPRQNRGQIIFAANPYMQVYNNTIVNTGRELQDYGIMENPQFPSVGARVSNNLVINANVAACGLNFPETAASANKAIGVTSVVERAGGGWVQQDAQTALVTADDIDMDSPFFSPIPGGRLDGTGARVSSVQLSLTGDVFVDPPPVGCMNP